jgi:CRISPR-associated protein Cas5d
MISEPIRLRVWGPYACFTRPEFHVERVSYPVITPSAARGILEAILMKPIEKPEAHKRRDKEGFLWHVLRIGIVREGTMMPILRNELGYSAHNYTGYDINDMKGVRTQRHSLILQGEEIENGEKRLEYIIEAVIETNGANMGKYFGTIKRRAEKGQCHHRPYFGCREFPCNFEWAPDAEPNPGINKPYGIIFRDFDFDPVWNHWPSDGDGDCARPRTWRDANGRTISPSPVSPLRAVAHEGWITIPPLEGAKGSKEVKKI